MSNDVGSLSLLGTLAGCRLCTSRHERGQMLFCGLPWLFLGVIQASRGVMGGVGNRAYTPPPFLILPTRLDLWWRARDGGKTLKKHHHSCLLSMFQPLERIQKMEEAGILARWIRVRRSQLSWTSQYRLPFVAPVSFGKVHSV